MGRREEGEEGRGDEGWVEEGGGGCGVEVGMSVSVDKGWTGMRVVKMGVGLEEERWG